MNIYPDRCRPGGLLNVVAHGGPSAMTPRVGRRPGKADTRAEIVRAAHACFGELGFNGASIRSIAQRAGVDPALVHHYFADKADLFVEAMELPGDPQKVAHAAKHARDDGTFDGATLVEHFLEQWEPAEEGLGSTSFVAMVQAVASSPEAADSMREFLTARLGPAHLGGDEATAAKRQSLVSTQLIGLGWTRYVLRLEPLASATRAEAARWVGPTIDRYFAEGVPADAPGGGGPRTARGPRG